MRTAAMLLALVAAAALAAPALADNCPIGGCCDSCPYGACQACQYNHVAKMSVTSPNYCPLCPGSRCDSCEVKHVATMLSGVAEQCPGCSGNSCGLCVREDVEKLEAITNMTAPISAKTPGAAYKHIIQHVAEKHSPLCADGNLEKCTFMDVASAVPDATPWRRHRATACPAQCEDCSCSTAKLAEIVMQLPGYCPGCMQNDCMQCNVGDIARHMANSQTV